MNKRFEKWFKDMGLGNDVWADFSKCYKEIGDKQEEIDKLRAELEKPIRKIRSRTSRQEIESLKEQNKIMREAIHRIDASNDDMEYYNSEINEILKEALAKCDKITR